MSRRDRVQLIVEEHETPASPLQQWIAAEDERLDADEETHRRDRRAVADMVARVSDGVEEADAFMLEGVYKPLVAVMVGGLRPPRKKREARFMTLREALSSWYYSSGATSARAGASATGRLANHCLTGGSHAVGARPPEPRFDDGVWHVGRAVEAARQDVGARAVTMLVQAEVAIDRESAKAQAEAMRVGDVTVTWAHLVAARHDLDGEAGVETVRDEVKRARRAISVRLRAIDLDGRPLLAPPDRPTRPSVEQIVPTCIGSVIANGVRGECGEGQALASDVAASPRCDRCHKPWAPKST